VTDEPRLERARAAAARCEWAEALASLLELDGEQQVPAADLELFANVAYAAGRLDLTIDVWERAHALAMQAGDRDAAGNAAIKIALHLLMDTALMAPIRGWIKRADDLLAGAEQPGHAWLAVVRTYERLLSGDIAAARMWAGRAIEIGTRVAPAAAAVARVPEARSMILEGNVREGLAMLEAAGVAALSGELDTISTGIVYCELLCALQGVCQFEQADQWSEAMESWSRTRAIGSFAGRCRVHRAEILRLRGSCAEAATEAQLACDELRPFLRRELGWPLTELGRIRLQQGNVDGADEAFHAAHEAGWQAQPGLALVQLARGEIEHAAAAISDALARPSYVPSKEFPPNNELQRAPLLAAQVEIGVAAGDLPRARSAASELVGIAARFESKALAAISAFALGAVCLGEGDAVAACKHLDEAVALWTEIGAPYEVAQARLRLADALERQGQSDRAGLERSSARASLERIGAATPVARIAAAPPVLHDGELVRREGDTWAIAFGGRLVRLRDLKGLRYLVRLLAEPGREMHAVDLVITEGGIVATDDGSTLLDARAKQVYRRRLAEIEDDLEQAHAMADLGRAAQAEEEHECLRRELSRAVGLDGRDRRGGSAERARVSVTRAIRQAMTRIAEHHPPLAAHLELTIRTGAFCAYQPDPRAPTAWRVEL